MWLVTMWFLSYFKDFFRIRNRKRNLFIIFSFISFVFRQKTVDWYKTCEVTFEDTNSETIKIILTMIKGEVLVGRERVL